MAYGFTETYYTQARRAGVIFIQYDLQNKPEVQPGTKKVIVKANEPIIGHVIFLP